MDYFVCPAGALALFLLLFRNAGSNFHIHFSGFQPFILQKMSILLDYRWTKVDPLPVQSNPSVQVAGLGPDVYHQPKRLELFFSFTTEMETSPKAAFSKMLC